MANNVVEQNTIKENGLFAFFYAPLAMIWRHRLLLRQIVANDIRARYAGSALGLIWLFLFPLLFLGVYALIYGVVFKVRFNLGDTSDFVVFIFCGLIPFLGFAEALPVGVVSVTNNANLIKNTLFPIELIPVRTILASQCTQIVGMGMLLLAVAMVGRLTPWALLVPVIWVFQMMFMIGLIWILSSLNVYFRDLQTMMSVVILFLMMVSPIAWSIEMMPPSLRPFMGLNPLYYLIISFQECLMGAKQEVMGGHFPRYGVFWGMTAIGLGFFFVGAWFFSRMKRLFADNI